LVQTTEQFFHPTNLQSSSPHQLFMTSGRTYGQNCSPAAWRISEPGRPVWYKSLVWT